MPDINIIKSNIILGIDPGSRITGYGIIECNQNNLKYITSGCIRIDTSGTFPDRLKQIFFDVTEIVKEYQPTHAAIEQVFLHHNPSSALKLGQARGAAICAITQFDITVGEYSARQIKQAVTAYGGAQKSQVQFMVKNLLNLSGLPQTDAADALAIAICHAHSTAF